MTGSTSAVYCIRPERKVIHWAISGQVSKYDGCGGWCALLRLGDTQKCFFGWQQRATPGRKEWRLCTA